MRQADAAAAEAAAKAPMPPPSLQEDLTLPGASTPAPAAAPVLSILQASWASSYPCLQHKACNIKLMPPRAATVHKAAA